MKPTPLVPPRPIPDPLDWPEPPTWPIWVVAGVVGAALVMFVLRGRAKRAREERTVQSDDAAPSSAPAPVLIGRAELLREALVVRFGPAWAARTTEEVAGSVELAATLSADRLAEVVALLQAADRAKFAVAGIGEEDLAPYSEDWLAAVLGDLAGATTPENRN